MAFTIRGLGIGEFLVAAAICAAQPVDAGDLRSGVRIRVYDYVGIAPAEIRKVTKVASNILRQARLNVVWLECRTSQDHPVKDRRCESEPTPLDLHLRIVGPEMAEAAGTHPDSFGYSWIVDGYGFVAAAYYHRAVEMERRNSGSRATVLGGIIAHEVGHLLLGEARHSNSGIMLAAWGPRELKSIAQGRLRFSEEQGRRIGRALVARANSDNAVAALKSVDVAALRRRDARN